MTAGFLALMLVTNNLGAGGFRPKPDEESPRRKVNQSRGTQQTKSQEYIKAQAEEDRRLRYQRYKNTE